MSRSPLLFILLIALSYTALMGVLAAVERREPRPPTAPQACVPIPVEDMLTDINVDGGAGGGKTMIPRTPQANQKKPPCGKGEHAINGACYMRWDKEDMMPPCTAGSLEHTDGRCYRAIADTLRPPTSINH